MAIGALVILGLVLFFYLFFRAAPKENTKWTSGMQGFDIDSEGNLTPKNSFTVVNRNV